MEFDKTYLSQMISNLCQKRESNELIEKEYQDLEGKFVNSN